MLEYRDKFRPIVSGNLADLASRLVHQAVCHSRAIRLINSAIISYYAIVRVKLTGRRGGEGSAMDDHAWGSPLDVSALSGADLILLGDSALGHAVRRALALSRGGQDPDSVDTIAAHDSHI